MSDIEELKQTGKYLNQFKDPRDASSQHVEFVVAALPELIAAYENLGAVMRWLSENQSDVFRRGLWDAIGESGRPQPPEAVAEQGELLRQGGLATVAAWKMQQECIKACDKVEVGAMTDNDKSTSDYKQGIANGAADCAYAIRRLSSAKMANASVAASQQAALPVKRYDMTTEYNRFACEDQVTAVESADGAWVKYEDHLAATNRSQP